ncbi:MAG TPA: hypothetical protein VKA94_06795 [Hyphomicrobiales bacterium]|nr:hypothetical protein [Hyphomicrobiales bacterium]
MRNIVLLAVIAVSFLLYCETSKLLIEKDITDLFGADTHLYLTLATGTVNDQIQLFHPLTVYLTKAWMAVFSPIRDVIGVDNLSGAMYALIGAGGVAAAYSAFRRLLPSSYVITCTIAYAFAFSGWYFSSIHETKIIDGSIASIYIAIYLYIREKWSPTGALALTAVLIIGCFNAIVTAFLVAIPAIDTFLRENYRIRKLGWVALHAMPVPLIFIALELLIDRSIAAGANEAEANGHFDLLLTFAALGDHGIASWLGFALNWMLFSLAAPASNADYSYAIWEDYHGYFEPSVLNYFGNGATGLFLVMLCIMLATVVIYRRSDAKTASLQPLLIGLAAYSLIRSILFFVFIPAEALLYTPPVILAHLLILFCFFIYSDAPYKKPVLYTFVAALFISNMRFLFG